MISYGICIGDESQFQKIALPGLKKYTQPDARVQLAVNQSSIFAAYNSFIDTAIETNADILVLLHEDVEILDANMESKLRTIFSTDESVGVVGVVGASNITSLSWWEAGLIGRVFESRGILGQFDFTESGSVSVDCVDGLFMAIHRRAFSSIRFDSENYSGFHGYDVDFCFSCRSVGLSVVVARIDVAHHTKGGVKDQEMYDQANSILRAKWNLGLHPSV